MDDLLADCDYAGPASEDRIRTAQAELYVVFPNSYTGFLRQYGAVVGRGFYLAGLSPETNDGSETPFWTDVVTLTKQMRRSARGALDPFYVAISDDGGDYVFYIDTRSADGQESRVVALGPGAEGVPVASSFSEFVARLVSDTMFV